jgi:hypothetical protein
MSAATFLPSLTREIRDEIQRITPAQAVVLVEGGYATLIEPSGRDHAARWHIEGAVSMAGNELEAAPAPAREPFPRDHLLILCGVDPTDSVGIQRMAELVRCRHGAFRLAVLLGDRQDWSDVGFSVVRGWRDR